MTSSQMSELHKLSVEDKLEVVQSLLDDIAKEQSMVEIPDAHKKILDERMHLISSGEATFKPWSEIQQKFAEK